MEILAILKKSPAIKKLFLENHVEMTDAIITSNISALYDYYEDSKFDCTDIKKTCERPNQLKKKLVFRNDQFYLKSEYCEHFLHEHPFQMLTDQFIFQDVNMEEFEGTLAKIEQEVKKLDESDETKEARQYLLEKIATIIKNDEKQGIYLYGNPGIGKTYLLKAVAKKMAQLKKTVVFVTTGTLLSALKDNMSSESRDFNLSISDCQTADVLFLDDLGQERVTKWSRDEVLFPIINFRSEHKKLTFFASNYSIENLMKHYSLLNDGVQDLKDHMGAMRIINRIHALTPIVKKMEGKQKRGL